MYTAGGLLLTVYLAVSWRGSGRTYGNHVMGLRVVNHRGQRLHPVVSFVRAALYVIFPIGLLWVLVSGHNRSLQDLVVRTSVIYDWGARRSARSGTDSDLTPRHPGALRRLVSVGGRHSDHSC